MPITYDYLVVGAGLYGCVFARQLKDAGYSVLVIDKRNHIGGNCYIEDMCGIKVHMYGPHIFHTNNQRVWEYINRFTTFNGFINRPIAYNHGEIYSLPFNMYTFNKLFGVTTPEEARKYIENEVSRYRERIGSEPKNLEEQALLMVGGTVYRTLVKEYTEKQWGRPCTELPPEIIKRLPLRFTYDNNYFNARWQGIPDYEELFKNLLDGIPYDLGMDYCKGDESFREYVNSHVRKVVFTGCIDEYFGYKLGELEYRSLRFDTKILQGVSDYQGNAVVNYTSHKVPYTRIVEHKHFSPVDVDCTVITKEYSQEWQRGVEPFYPINNAKNAELYWRYTELAKKDMDVIFGGRLGEYQYHDMDVTIEAALRRAEREINVRQ